VPQEELPEQTITGSQFSTDTFFLSFPFPNTGLPGYDSVTNYVLDILAKQPNYVELQPKAPAPREDPQLDEVEVTGTRPSISDRQFPVEVSPFETHDMNDQELADYYGGGDAGYEQMWRERHPQEPMPGSYEEDFVDMFTVPPKVDVRQYIDDRTMRRTPGAPGKPFVYRGLPELPDSPLPAGGSWLARLLPWLGLFVPLRSGPRQLDEAPEWWDLPDIRGIPPRPPVFTPLPDFLHPELEPQPLPEIPFDQPYFQPGTNPRERPIDDPFVDPGMFADPAGLPDFPLPKIDFRPEPRSVPQPIGDPSQPYWPSLPTNPYYPNPPDEFVPRVPPKPDPFDPSTPDPVELPLPKPVPLPFDPPMEQPLPDGIIPHFDFPVDLATPSFPYAPPDDAKKDCKCAPCKDKKDKKKKKPKERTVCYEGHYVEHSRGLTKKRGKQIPCEKGQAAQPRARRPGRAPSLPGLARDIFGLPA